MFVKFFFILVITHVLFVSHKSLSPEWLEELAVMVEATHHLLQSRPWRGYCTP
jgi:hypothetical protein